MFPLLPFKANLRSSPSQPTPSIENSFGSSFTFASSSSSLLSPTSPPPSAASTAFTATDSLLDTAPSKASITTNNTNNKNSTNAYGQSSSSSCAFPSWPNRPSLISTNTSTSTTSASSAYISDEELLDTPLSPSVEVDCPVPDGEHASLGMSLATEQRIKHMREVAEEEEHRARFLAQVQAHARAQQMAMRVAQGLPPLQEQPVPVQPLQQQQQQPIAPRRKRRAIVPVGKKRRATSSTSSRCYPRV